MKDRGLVKKSSVVSLWADKALIASIFLFYVTLFLFYSWFPLNAAPILLGLAIYFPYLLAANGTVLAGHLGALLFLVLFSILACTYLIVERGAGAIISMIFVFFASLPLLFIAIARVHDLGGEKFIVRVFLAFLIWQSLVVLWQIAGRVSSIGFDSSTHYNNELPENYALMLSGTYYNSNDLAGTVGAIFAFFVLLKGQLRHLSTLGVFLCVFLALATASRAVLLFFVVSTLYYSYSKSALKGALAAVAGAGLSLVIFFVLTNYFRDIGFVERISERFLSIIRVITEGVDSDNSMTLRLVSYFQFLSNLDSLGLGSVKLKDYYVFVGQLGPRFELMAVNPHSFIVEVGYWLGWAGLALWLFFIAMMASKDFGRYLYAIFSFLVLSMVSSSIFNNFMFFTAIFALLIFSHQRSLVRV